MQDDGAFDAAVAATYDALHGATDPAVLEQTVSCLAKLAQGGSVLEFAIGTGRVALPLQDRGCDVAGIELSSAMVAELRKKETGSPIEIAIGDMTTTRLSGTFSLVALVFNTIDNLTTQDAQVACFENAARHLVPGGRFVVETMLPQLQNLPFGETRVCFANEADHVGVDEIDVVTQTYTSHHVWINEDQHQQLHVPFRYAWPSEMDLMAQIAGMTLEHRWEDWAEKPFTRFSRKHVSVWRKTA